MTHLHVDGKSDDHFVVHHFFCEDPEMFLLSISFSR